MEHGITMVHRISDFALTMLPRDGLLCNEKNKQRCPVYLLSEAAWPVFTRADSFIEPDVKSLVMNPLQFRIDSFVIRVGIAHKDVGFVQRLPGKERILGIRADDVAMVFPVGRVRNARLVHAQIGSLPVVLAAPKGLPVVAYDRRLKERVLTFTLSETTPAALRDVETGTVWRLSDGLAVNETDRFIQFDFSDGTRAGLHIRRAVAELVVEPDTHVRNPDLTVAMSGETWAQLYLSQATPEDLIEGGDITVSGDSTEAARLINLFDRYSPQRAVVIPPATLVQGHP